MVKEQLLQIVERIERLETEKSEIAEDIKSVYSEAKGNGYDTKALKKIVATRKKDAHTVAEENAIFETYLTALGMNLDV